MIDAKPNAHYVIYLNNKKITERSGCYFGHYYYKYLEWLRCSILRLPKYKKYQEIGNGNFSLRYDKYKPMDIKELLDNIECVQYDKWKLENLKNKYENRNINYNEGIAYLSDCSYCEKARKLPKKMKVDLYGEKICVKPVFISKTSMRKINQYLDNYINEMEILYKKEKREIKERNRFASMVERYILD